MTGPASKVTRAIVTGPLAPYAPALAAALRERGYTPLSAVNTMRLVAHLSRWLEASGLSAGDLNSEVAERYAAARRAEGRSFALLAGSIAPITGMLADAGALMLPLAVPGPVSEQDRLLAGFERHLLRERALAATTTEAYVARARRFLTGLDSGGLPGLTAADVTAAVAAEAAKVSAGSAQYFVAALRAFLRYCFLEGLVLVNLAGSALSVTGRRISRLPLGIGAADAAALLASCDRSRDAGRRDYAVLITLLRLGLRASEAASLRLEDIDWRAGEITVLGKGNRAERLPLPADVGEAIAAYLTRGSPKAGAWRQVFLRTVAPAGPLTRGGISFIVRRACTRAGIAEVGAHRLRHSTACQLADAGAPLTEVGQLLRHESLASAANYARVSVAALRELARPWPGAAA
jgi:integrase/recombinase XerD